MNQKKRPRPAKDTHAGMEHPGDPGNPDMKMPATLQFDQNFQPLRFHPLSAIDMIQTHQYCLVHTKSASAPPPTLGLARSSGAKAIRDLPE